MNKANTAADLEMRVGSRIQLMRDVERFPHFIARKGARGTIVSFDKHGASARMDDKLESCEEWGNCILWECNDETFDDFSDDIQMIES